MATYRPAPTRPSLAISPNALRRAGQLATTYYWVLAVAMAWIAFMIRAGGLRSANDLFIDELTYTRLATTVSHGHLPNLAGHPFFLHPPGGFLIDGLVIKMLGLSGTTMDVVYQLRWVNAVLGAIMVALAFLLVRRVATLPIATIAAAVLAFDPFILRNDSRVMLETPTTMFLLAGWLLIVIGLTRRPARLSTPMATSAGLLLGLSVLIKDLALVPVLLPLALATLWRSTLRPSRSVLIVATAAVPYAAYLAALAVSGLLGQWWKATSFGLQRMAGAAQITGFNAPGAPSLSSRLLDQIGRFGTSYALIAICVIVGVFAAFSAHPGRRIVGILAFTTGLLGLYAAFVGTLEEQFGYYVVVTSVLACSGAAADLISRRSSRRLPLGIVASVFLATTIALGITARATTDDGFIQSRAWLNNLPPRTHVGLTDVTAEFALLSHPGYGVWPSLASLNAHHAQYVLTRSRQLSQGYGYAAPQLLSWLKTHATAVFNAQGPSSGNTTVWRLNPAALHHAASDGKTIPPVTGTYK